MLILFDEVKNVDLVIKFIKLCFILKKVFQNSMKLIILFIIVLIFIKISLLDVAINLYRV